MPFFTFQLRSIFVVLSDDLFREILRKFEKKNQNQKSGPSSSAPKAPVPVTPDKSPQPTADPSTRSKSRTNKRGPPSDSSGPSAKK